MTDQTHDAPVKPVLLEGMTHTVSGTYHPLKRDRRMWECFFHSAQFRLDIDNWYPLRRLSCTVETGAGKTDLLFTLKKSNETVWSASLIKKTGEDNPIGKSVTISLLPREPHARPHFALTISKADSETTLICRRVSSAFHSVTVEIDRVKNISEATAFSPRSHKVHSSALSGKSITLKKVFNRAGFDVTFSPDRDIVPMERAGKDRAWSNRELHDAMQTYWAHFSDIPQWSLWIFYATSYKESPFTGGLMFDTAKEAKRRGVALFDQSPLFEAPADDRQSEAWERRIRFWTTCHEMGHLFNLAHSWDKEKGTGWLPQKNNEESLSFMNYPSYFPEGQQGYFSRFMYRFDDDELTFLRHAPAQYVQMGNSSWLTNHAFAAADRNRCKMALQLRSQKNNHRYHFMEPVIIECKLKNVSTEEVTLPFSASFLSQKLSLVITDNLGRYHHHRPFFRSDYTPHETRLAPGESCYDWLFASADCDRWTIADPGTYTLQAFFHFNSEVIISEIITIIVDRPEKEAEQLAQDYFCNDIARIFAFDGSTVLSTGTDILEQCLERSLPEPVVCHTRLALASPLQYESRKIEISRNGEMTLRNMRADPDKTLSAFNTQLLDNNSISVETLGNIKYKLFLDNYCDWLIDNELHDEAMKCQMTLLATLEKRNVKNSVLSEVKSKLFKLQTLSDRYALLPLP